ncbi:alpha/beta fold hydrolase [Aliikangiella maris]|uniref:Alpha/beta fold hydrolase n=2 Tax=Aliikangiella maris TaxID=3162458 RepID=A0ABV3MK29_9GAMM
MFKSEFKILLAHGAGANKDSDWMQQMDQLISAKDLTVFRFDFPYMRQRLIDGKRRPPDRMPRLIDDFNQQIKQLKESQRLLPTDKLILAGKSMGGRVASLLATESAPDFKLEFKISGLIAFGFPFHPANKPEKFRGEHLAHISIPTLILQGERDSMGKPNEIEGHALSKQVCVEYLADGDHSFKPRVKSGLTLADNLQTAADKVADFIFTLDD